VDEVDQARVRAALRVGEPEVRAMEWVDNGPGWVGVLLAGADAVLALDPDWAAFGDLDIGVIGLRRDGDTDAEVRAFCPGLGITEDPVTGSLNAGLAQWLTADGTLPASYVAAQGTVLGRAGRVHVERRGDAVWVGGDTVTRIAGTVRIGG
jgi:PhzF family phenazine biosynthesis protein